jgi:hypothetical protein
VSAGRDFFQKAADSSGVIPDQSSFTGQSMGSAGSDAKRCVMNIMMDANFFGADPWQTTTYTPAFAAWMKSHSDNSAAQFSCNPHGDLSLLRRHAEQLGLLHVSGTFKLW